MLILGLVLVVAGALVIVAAIGTGEGQVDFLGTDVGALTLFLIGVASGLTILLGLALVRYGARRAVRQRRERARLQELSEKLDRVEHDRHRTEGPEDRG